jgi:predicted secreted protein
MTIFTTIMVFVVAWWLIFFMVLPWGVRRPEQVEPGHADGAPDKPRLWLKAAVTTGIAILVTGAIYGAVEADLISFRPPR